MKLNECNDKEFLRSEVERLWKIIDDIDTTSDIVKENDSWYRKIVEKLVLERFYRITSDGYDLYVGDK